MPRWTPEDLAAYERRQTDANLARLRASEPKRDQGKPLEPAAPRKASRRTRAAESPAIRCRCRIVFTIYAVRPCDWDNPHIKELQDLLVQIGVLPGDDWKTLEGCVRSRKADKKEDERTEITIEQVVDFLKENLK